MNENNANPSIGGADLECYLSYEHLGYETIVSIATAIGKRGFSYALKSPFFATGSDYSLPFELPEVSNANMFTNRVGELDCHLAILNFEGRLADVDVMLSVSFHFMNGVVVISVPENMIWNFSENVAEADRLRLVAFANLCQVIAQLKKPSFASLGTEEVHSDEMPVDQLEEAGAKSFTESMFSTDAIRELYEWYVNEYATRWNSEEKS